MSSKTGTSQRQKSSGSANMSKQDFNKNALNEDGFPIDSIKEDQEENMVTIDNKSRKS